ncbi:MAG: type I polyketide synthase [Gordonia sp. (in: high G+C Gram-positive bacteria)]
MAAREFDDDSLRQWLIDYLVTTLGCERHEVDPEVSMSDLGVGSRDSLVLSGELSELLGRQVSPVEFWEHPTINALIDYLLHGEQVDVPVAGESGQVRTDEPIAVIGMSCRFPGGINGAESYWQFLVEGRDAVGTVPQQRWASYDDGTPEVRSTLAATTRHAALLDNIEGFDAEFFEITAREATKMDPQQRLLLEIAWEALEHAGIAPGTLKRSPTGVFVGACAGEYGYLGSTDLPNVDAWSNLGGALSIIANRLSYFLDLRGPSLTIDTACSSSLVAIHLACQSLRLQDCNVALAGGVNVLLSPGIFQGFDQSAALSPTGACHTFDADADGFVRGEGCGVVVLKRLGDALRDGDRVLAVIRGSAVNQDGHSNGLFAPNPAAQMEVLRSAYQSAGISAREVDYVETHGTGTLLGDPIEARALGSVLGRGRAADAPLLLGAVKTNLGHLEAAAGIAGFIKSVLAVSRASIPGNLHYRNPNPHIPFEQLRLRVVDSHQRWPASSGPRRAGISSFGFGGTNAHVVIEQAPVVRRALVAEETPSPAVTTLVVSAKSPERVAAYAQSLAEWMEHEGAGVPLPDIAHTLNHHRAVLPVFGTVTARDRHAAIAGLRGLAAGEQVDGVTFPVARPVGSGTVFVYSGQGSHWVGMAARLLADEPAFAAAIAEIEPDFVAQLGFSLRQAISDSRELHGDAQVQPVLMGVQLALTKLWAAHGVHPDAVIGQSMGEVSAAVVAGALTVAEGLRVIAVRSALMSRLGGTGAVALLRLPESDVQALITEYPGVEISGILAPRQTVVAGPVAAVAAVIDTATDRGHFARRVNMEVASHTALMDPILDELRTALTDIAARTPRVEFFSTVDVSVPPTFDAEYWAANVRRPVLLADAVNAAATEHRTFIEISPHPILTQAIADTLEASNLDHNVIGTLARDRDDTVVFHTGRIAALGTRPPTTAHLPEPHPVLPPTPWQHVDYWLPEPVRSATATPVAAAGAAGAAGPVDTRIPAGWWLELTWPTLTPVAATAADVIAAQADTSWLVVGERDGAAIAARLGEAQVKTLSVEEFAALDAAGISAAVAGVDRVLFAPPTVAGDQAFAAEPGYEIFSTARRLVSAVINAPGSPRVHLLTRNAQPVADGDRAVAAHAVLWGLGRSLALEHPEIWGGMLDVDDTVPAAVVAGYVLAEASADDEDQVVYRAGARHAARLRQRAPLPLPADTGLAGDGAQLVIGATGNIGPHVIRQLADMGAATVVAVSRNPGSRLDELIAELAARGVRVVPVAADSADRTSMAALFDRFGKDLPRLDGVYLAAFGGGPVTLADMSDADVEAMFRPKLDALATLHELTLHHPVSRFVLFSSISGLTGSRWLSHYAATTTFQDTFAYARRAAGLPATTVNWGLWKSLDDTQSEADRQVTRESGLVAMEDSLAIAALASAGAPHTPTQVSVVAADWPTLAAAYRTRAVLRIVDDLLPANDSELVGAHTEFRTALGAAASEDRLQLLADHVAALVAKVMGLSSAQQLDPTEGFFQFGMDSLMSVTLQRTLSQSLGEPLPTSVIFDYPSVEALTAYLVSTLPETADIGVEEPSDDFDELSDDELLKALSERLG